MIDDILSLLPGLGISLQLTVISMLIGIPLGVLAALGLRSRSRIVRTAVGLLTELGRGFPVLVILYMVYFGLPGIGIALDGFTTTTLALGFSSASYMAEIFKSAMDAVPTTHREAAAALGMPARKTFRLIILPQAWRICLAPIIGMLIIFFHATALAYSIGLRELLNIAYDKGAVAFDVLHYLILAGLFYLVVSLALGFAATRLGREKYSSKKLLSPTSAPLIKLETSK